MHTATRRAAATTAVLILLIVMGGLFFYKWSGSWRTLVGAQAAGAFVPRSELIATASIAPALLPFVKTINYLVIVWPALLFGILIAGGVRAFVSTDWLTRLLGTGGVRQHVVAGIASAPLMLCSCCAAPIFASVYQRSAKLGPSLGVMIGSPSLNLAALALTLMLFPRPMALARVVMAVAAVFILTAVVGRIFRGSKLLRGSSGDAGALDATGGRGILAATKVFAASSGWLALRTVPIIVLGVLLSTWIVELFPGAYPQQGSGKVIVIALVALLAVPLALPTFFELPLALLLINAGAPAGAAVAVLFAGPAINLPSLLTVARETSWKVAVTVGALVWLVATAGGLLVG